MTCSFLVLGFWFVEWDNCVAMLDLVGIKLNNVVDRLVWNFNCKSGIVTDKLAYIFIMDKIPTAVDCSWHKELSM